MPRKTAAVARCGFVRMTAVPVPTLSTELINPSSVRAVPVARHSVPQARNMLFPGRGANDTESECERRIASFARAVTRTLQPRNQKGGSNRQAGEGERVAQCWRM